MIAEAKMKKKFMLFIGIAVLIVAALFLLVSCNNKEPEKLPLEDINAKTDLINITDANIAAGSTQKCDIDGIIYYVKDPFIYHINNRNDQIVYSQFGTYTKLVDREIWTLELYRNKNRSIYLDTTKWINDKKLPNDSPIDCVSTDSIPKNFADFYRGEEPFLNKKTVAKYGAPAKNNSQSL
jgi:hypothetical protein